MSGASTSQKDGIVRDFFSAVAKSTFHAGVLAGIIYKEIDKNIAKQDESVKNNLKNTAMAYAAASVAMPQYAVIVPLQIATATGTLLQVLPGVQEKLPQTVKTITNAAIKVVQPWKDFAEKHPQAAAVATTVIPTIASPTSGIVSLATTAVQKQVGTDISASKIASVASLAAMMPYVTTACVFGGLAYLYMNSTDLKPADQKSAVKPKEQSKGSNKTGKSTTR